MEFFALFIFLIIILFFLSRRLTSEIFKFCYHITRSEHLSTNVLAFIFFPGVVVHELSHYFAAKSLFVPTGKISLSPKREGNYIRLGSVQIAKSNIFKEFIIGIAPLFVGVALILVIVYFFLVIPGFGIPRIVISFYAIFLISNTMYTSRRDLEAAVPSLIIIFILGTVFFIGGIKFPQISVEFLPHIEPARIFLIGSLYLIIPVIIDSAVILLLRIFDRMW